MIEAKDFKVDLGNDINELKKDVIASFKSDPEMYAFIHENLKLTTKEVNVNLASLVSYKEDKDYCKNCPGLANCAKAYPRYNLILRRDFNDIVCEYTMCPFALAEQEKRSRYIIRDFPKEWLDIEMENIDLNSASRKRLLKEFLTSVKTRNNKWFFIKGNHGCGKSLLAAAYSNYYLKKVAKGGVYTNLTKLIGNLSSLFIENKPEFNKRFDAISNSPLVVIDDFGNEFPTDFSFSNIIFPLIHYRATKNLPTCFVSEFGIDEIKEVYSKINRIRVNQLTNIIKEHIGDEFDVSGVSYHSK